MSLSALDQLYAEFEVVHAQRLNAAHVTRRKRQTHANERRELVVGIGMICGNACS